METLQITFLSEYYDLMLDNINELGLNVLTYGSTDSEVSLIIEGNSKQIAIMEDFVNGERF